MFNQSLKSLSCLNFERLLKGQMQQSFLSGELCAKLVAPVLFIQAFLSRSPLVEITVF